MKKQILFCSLLSLFMFGGMSNVWGTENLALGAFFDVVKSNPPAELDVNAFYQDLLDKIKNTDITVDNLGKAFMLSCKAHVNAANPCDICYKFAMDIEDRYKELNTQKCSQADAEYKDGKCVCPNDGVYDKTTNTCLFKMETSASIVAANEVKVEDPSMTMKTPLQTLCEQDGVGTYKNGKCICTKDKGELEDDVRCISKAKRSACQKATGTYTHGKCVCPSDGTYDETTSTCIPKAEHIKGAVPGDEVITPLAQKPFDQLMCEQNGIGKYENGQCVCPAETGEMNEDGQCVPKSATTVTPATTTANDASVLRIKIDLNGGTRISGNCDELVVHMGPTPAKANCVAQKNGRKMVGYRTDCGDGIARTTEVQYGFSSPLTTEAERRCPFFPTKLIAEYEESGTPERVVGESNDGNKWQQKTQAGQARIEQNQQMAEKKNAEEQNAVNVAIQGTNAQTSTTVAKADVYKYKCDINYRHVQLKKASDAKTADDLQCVFGFVAEEKCVGGMLKSIHALFDTSAKRAVYYCEKMDDKQDAFDFKHYETAVCCNISGENVTCRNGKTVVRESLSRSNPTFADCD